MIYFFPLALGQLLDGKLDITVEFLRKPHKLQLFRFLGSVAVG